MDQLLMCDRKEVQKKVALEHCISTEAKSNEVSTESRGWNEPKWWNLQAEVEVRNRLKINYIVLAVCAFKVKLAMYRTGPFFCLSLLMSVQWWHLSLYLSNGICYHSICNFCLRVKHSTMFTCWKMREILVSLEENWKPIRPR